MGCSPFANYRFQMGVTVMGFAEHFGHNGAFKSLDTARVNETGTIALL